MTMFSKIWGGAMAPLLLPGYAYARNDAYIASTGVRLY